MKHQQPSITKNFARALVGGFVLAPLLFAATAQVHPQTPALTPMTGQTTPRTAAAQPAAAASAARPERRVLTPGEKRDSATAPGELRPSDPVVPQLRIPLGRNAGDAAIAASGVSAGNIDDDAARCRAQANAADRARCGAGAPKIMAKPSLRP